MGVWRYSSTFLDIGTRWSGQLDAPAALLLGDRSCGTHWMGGWVGPRAGLAAVEDWDSSVGVGRDYGLDGPVSIPGSARETEILGENLAF
jgi:hypothetical protein